MATKVPAEPMALRRPSILPSWPDRGDAECEDVVELGPGVKADDWVSGEEGLGVGDDRIALVGGASGSATHLSILRRRLPRSGPREYNGRG